MESVVKKVKGHCHIHGCKQWVFKDRKIRFCKKCQEIEKIELNKDDFYYFWQYYEGDSEYWKNMLQGLLIFDVFQTWGDMEPDIILKPLSEYLDIKFKFKWDVW